MVVCAIIIVIFSFSVPALTGLSKANNLNTGGRLVSDILTAARSEAITQRRLVQVRVATRWMNSTGGEDTAASYRKFSVWRRPQPDDPQQPAAGTGDAFIQVSKWETLPAGITFELDPDPYGFPTVTTVPKYLGTNFLDGSLANRKTGVTTAGSTVDVAWIEFAPTGAVTSSGGSLPGRIYMLITEGFWDGTAVTSTNNRRNWIATTIETLVGRTNTLRP